MRTKKFLVFLLVLTMCFSFIGCSKDSNTEKEVTSQSNASKENANTVKEKQIMKFALSTDTPTMDPTFNNSTVTWAVLNALDEGLVRIRDGEILPGMAEKWEISDDGKTYTFHLRDAVWSDGKPVTAYDFEYGIKRLVNPETAAPFAFMVYLVENGEKVNRGELELDKLGVKAIDEKTFEIKLVRRTEFFLSLLGRAYLFPIREDLVKKFGNDFAADADSNVYNGPFVLKEWSRDNRIVFEKNPKYWNKDVINLDEVHMLIIPNPDTAIGMFENGEIDFCGISSTLAVHDQYKDMVKYYEIGAVEFLQINHSEKSILRNTNLRRALAYAIDRTDFVNMTTSGICRPCGRLVLPAISGIEKTYGEEYPEDTIPDKANVEKSKEYLNKALKELNLSNPSDVGIEFLTTDRESARIQAETIQDMWVKNLGINIKIKQVPYKQRLEMTEKGEFDIIAGGWVPDYNDPMTYLEILKSDSPYNYGKYNNQEFDKYLEKADKSANKKDRLDELFEAEKILIEDAVSIPLHHRRDPWVINPKLKGITRSFKGDDPDFVFGYFEE